MLDSPRKITGILLDQGNVEAFVHLGGIDIHHTSNQQTIRELPSWLRAKLGVKR